LSEKGNIKSTKNTREWLKLKRQKANLSQKQISKMANISQSHYSGIEAGKENPSIPVAKRISEILGFNWVLFFD